MLIDDIFVTVYTLILGFVAALSKQDLTRMFCATGFFVGLICIIIRVIHIFLIK